MIGGVICIFNVHIHWNASTFLENLSIWLTQKGILQYLPIFIIWNIWKARNRLCFDDQEPILNRLLYIIYDDVMTFKPPPIHKHRIRNIGKSPTSVYPMIFFYGAAANMLGGAGIYIWLNEQHMLAFKLGCGSCTNTRAELLALWASLWVPKDIGLPYLHIFGDSSVIINWEKKESTLDMVNLEAWCFNTRILMSSFMWVDLSHVYREHNRRADILSKEGLHMTSGHLILTEFLGNEIIGESSS